MRGIFDDPDHELAILETGYRKPLSVLSVSDKAAVASTLKTHVLARVKPELDQFADGLNICGVLEAAHSFFHPHSCGAESRCALVKCLYFLCVHENSFTHFSADQFKTMFNVLFSEEDEVRKERERATYVFFMDFLEECEGVLLLCACYLEQTGS